MAQLTRGMYGSEFNPQSNLFGLTCGQVHGGMNKRTHNSGWYNKTGEKLGWGDLATPDMARIALALEPDELFIVLSEGDSSWETRQRGVQEEAPGLAYVAEHALYVIALNHLYMVTDYWRDSGEKSHNYNDHIFLLLTRKEAVRFIEMGVLL